MNDDFIISIEDVTISFGDLIANDGVTLNIRKGEILALLGENGAGKSTLMKILYGLYSRKEGKISIDSEQMPLKYAPSDAIERGVSMVSQHFLLVDSFTVAENIILGEEKQLSRVFYNKERAYEQVDKLCKEYGIDVSPDAIVEELPLGVKQKIEILKALHRGGKVLILDEPTTVLTPQETSDLFILLRNLQNKGLTIILITHKLHEVMEVTDRVAVMRHGKMITTFDTKDTNVKILSRTMVGEDVDSIHVDEAPWVDGQVASLRMQNVYTKKDGVRCNLKGFDLELYPGRIVGVAGIDGNGQTDLAEVLTGIKRIQSGKLLISDKDVASGSVKTMRSSGIGTIPEDRHAQGLVLNLTIRDNVLIGYMHDKRFVNKGIFKISKINQYVDGLIAKYDIRPQRKSGVCKYISGGNQQKVVLARELERPNLQIVVAAQPSRGLDVGAIQFTYQMILRLREEGKAILLISSDLDEILALSDDVVVIRDGSVAISCKTCDLSKEEIGLYMGSSHLIEEGLTQ